MVLALVSLLFATNTNYEPKETRIAGDPVLRLEYGNSDGTYGLDDTLGIQTGNSITIYRDSAAAKLYGFSGDLFTGDSIKMDMFGYGESDTTQVQIITYINPFNRATKNNYLFHTDTVSFLSATQSTSSFKVLKKAGYGYIWKVTAFGATDSTNILGIRIGGE